MSKLTNKVALVTGGSRGIGAAIAKRLAADGANVAITFTKGADAAAAVVSEIELGGRKAIAIQADANDPAVVEAAVEKTVATLGQLDVLVNNAGTAIPKKFEETTLEEIDIMFSLNVRGALVATRAALKHMKNGGRIIMIGSCVGERNMTPGLAAYSATKGGHQDVYSRVVERSGRAGHHGQQCPAWPNRYRFEPRGQRVGGTAEGRYSTQAVRNCRRSCSVGRLCGGSGGGIHHGCESYCRWRHECLMKKLLIICATSKRAFSAKVRTDTSVSGLAKSGGDLTGAGHCETIR